MVLVLNIKSSDLNLFTSFISALTIKKVLMPNNMMLLRRTFSTRVKAFSDIPGPRSLPVIGTLWCYLPIIGSYHFDRLHWNGKKKLEEFGAVVKEEIVPGEPVVWIFRPEDIQELFRKEGRYPQRRSHLAIQHIRLNKPDVYNTGGLLPTNGPEWFRLRSSLQKELSSPQSVKTFIPVVNKVLDNFIKYLKETYDSRPVADNFLLDLSRVFLELVGIIAFGANLRSFTSKELDPKSRTSQLIDAALQANSCVLRTDNGPQLWRYFATPLYRKLKKSHDHMERVALDELKNLLNLLDGKNTTDEDSCLMETYLKSPKLDFKDVLGMAVDMILAGTDTTSYSTSFALYYLARNPEKQQKLFEEIEKHEVINSVTLGSCHYVKAVLKESLRLNPVSVGVGRLLQEDAVFSGYHVPSGTVVVTQNQVSCRSEKYFSNADKFIPERWLKESSAFESVSPYLLLPFGHGSRTCIARRLAEQNIQLLLLKLVKNFSIEWMGGDLDVISLLINKPDGPIQLKFTPR